MSHDLLVQFVL